MTNVFIIHGTYGYPEENWFPWLKVELEKLGCRVFVPKFPTPENQTLKSWLDVFNDYRKHLDENSVVVGHSLGPAFLLNVLEKLNNPIKAAFFVAGFVGLLGNNGIDRLNGPFVDKKFNWERIRQNCPRFFVFHSDNYPYVPLEKAKELARNLGVDIILVKNAGHFNTKAGYDKFNLLLKKIMTVL